MTAARRGTRGEAKIRERHRRAREDEQAEQGGEQPGHEPVNPSQPGPFLGPAEQHSEAGRELDGVEIVGIPEEMMGTEDPREEQHRPGATAEERQERETAAAAETVTARRGDRQHPEAEEEQGPRIACDLDQVVDPLARAADLAPVREERRAVARRPLLAGDTAASPWHAG